MDLKQFSDEILLPALNYPAILSPLNPISKGNSYSLTCPKCGKKEAFIRKGNWRIKCNHRTSCGYREHIFAYLNQNVMPKGKAYYDTVRQCSELSGISCPEHEYTPEELERLDEWEQKQRLWHDFADICNLALNDEELGKAARQYLESRGISLDLANQWNLGFYPHEDYFVDELKKRNHIWSKIESSGVYRSDFKDRISFPIIYQDRIGDFTMRDITGQAEENKKYVRMSKNAGSDVGMIFGLSDVHENIIVVEGPIDAIKLRANGINNTVALGWCTIIDEQVAYLHKHRVKSITLLLDSDVPGRKGVLNVINKLKNEDFNVYVIPPDILKEAKDPDLFVTMYPSEVQSLLPSREHCFRYYAREITNRCNQSKQRKDYELTAALEEATSFDGSVTNPKSQAALSEFFWPEFIKQTDINEATTAQLRQNIQEKVERVARQKAWDETQKNLQRLDPDDPEFFNKLKKLNDDFQLQCNLQDKNSLIGIAPYTCADLQKALSTIQPGLKTGFTTLDEFITIPNAAITLVGARPSHGKTTLLLKILLNMVKEYPKKRFYFFSYEEAIEQIAIKIIVILAGQKKDLYKNVDIYEDYIRKGSAHEEEIENAKTVFDLLVKSGRLNIVATDAAVQDLVLTINNEKNVYGVDKIGAVFVDYIQKIKNKERSFFGTRQLELQNTSSILLETAKNCAVPIILGAQLTRGDNKPRLDSFRECGDFEQDAKLALSLYNPAAESDSEEAKSGNDTVEITINPLKNRNGLANIELKLDFDRPILTIKDKTLPTNQIITPATVDQSVINNEEQKTPQNRVRTNYTKLGDPNRSRISKGNSNG